MRGECTGKRGGMIGAVVREDDHLVTGMIERRAIEIALIRECAQRFEKGPFFIPHRDDNAGLAGVIGCGPDKKIRVIAGKRRVGMRCRRGRIAGGNHHARLPG